MTTGTVISVIKKGTIITAIVRVLEENEEYTDYTAEVTWADFNALATDEEKIALIIAAWNAVRNPRVGAGFSEVEFEEWDNTEVTLD